MTQERVSVLVVDDSALMRSVISKIIESTDDLEVGGRAINGDFALRKLDSVKPDVILLDLEMPGMNGIEFLQERRKRRIDIPVIVLSSIAVKGARITMDALALGASEFILKPSGTDANELHRVEDQLISTIRAYGSRFRRKKTEKPSPPKTVEKVELRKPPTKKDKQPEKIDCIAIGISTGGPNALRQVFAGLDSRISIPLLVVQHMPAGFTAEFAGSLNRICALEVKEAEDGDIAQGGRVFIAPGDHHMKIGRKKLANVIELNQKDPVNGHRPSADILFSSVAGVYGERSAAFIMTGMGKDGAQAIGEVQATGGLTIGQDEATCVVYGMPRVADELGFLDLVLPLDEIAEYINRITRPGVE